MGFRNAGNVNRPQTCHVTRIMHTDRNSYWKWGKTKIKFGAGFDHLTRDSTKRLPGLKSVIHRSLKCLGLTTLELRLLHLDLIFCHKIVFGMVAISFSDIFEFSHVSKTRWHAYKLFKSHSNNSTRYRFFFAERVVSVWSLHLPASVNFSTLDSFKHSITDIDFTSFLKYA